MIRVEAYRQVRRLRTWLAFAGLAALPTIVAIANRLDTGGGHRGDVAERTLYRVSTASGINHALAALAFMSPFFLVIVVSMFAGESVAGEAQWGTLRSLLVRPVSRARLLASKLFVAASLAVAATLAVVLAGLVSGTLAFGWHDFLTPFLSSIPAGDAVGRLAIATLYVAWGVSGVVAFAFFLSTVTDAPAGAIGGAIGLAIASQILDGIRSLRVLHPGLITHYWSSWTALFSPLGSTAGMVRGALLQAVYVTVFVALAFWHFRRKDILS